MTQKQLTKLGRYWQKRLGVADWLIDFYIVRQFQMDPSHQAECRWNIEARTAQVAILNPIDWPPDSARPQDIERSLIHELLHVVLLPLVHDVDSKRNCVELEQVIESLARALAEDRRCKPKSQRR